MVEIVQHQKNEIRMSQETINQVNQLPKGNVKSLIDINICPKSCIFKNNWTEAEVNLI